MKNFILLILIFVSLNVEAQKKGEFFNNVNNELCMFLYEKPNQAAGSYGVYIVIEDLNESDQIALKNWKNASYDKNKDKSEFIESLVVSTWAAQGRRIECETMPIRMKPPIFKAERKHLILIRVPSEPAYDAVEAEELIERMKR